MALVIEGCRQPLRHGKVHVTLASDLQVYGSNSIVTCGNSRGILQLIGRIQAVKSSSFKGKPQQHSMPHHPHCTPDSLGTPARGPDVIGSVSGMLSSLLPLDNKSDLRMCTDAWQQVKCLQVLSEAATGITLWAHHGTEEIKVEDLPLLALGAFGGVQCLVLKYASSTAPEPAYFQYMATSRYINDWFNLFADMLIVKI